MTTKKSAPKKATTKKAAPKKAAASKPVTPPVAPGRSKGKTKPTPAEILAEMTPGGQQLAKQMAKQLEKTNSASVKTYYDVGEALHKAHKAEKTYGSNYIGQVADYLGYDKGQLYGYQQMAEEIPWKDVDAVLKAASVKHVPVYVGHFVAIARIADAKTRRALLNDVVEKRMTVNEILSVVVASGEQTVQRAAGAGRKQKAPTSPQVGLREATKRAKNLTTYLEEFGESHIYAKLDEIPPGSVTKNDYALMQELKEAVGALQAELDASMALFEPRFTRIENIRKRQEQEEDGEEVEEETEEEEALEEEVEESYEEEEESEEEESEEEESEEEESEEESEEEEDAINMADWDRQHRNASRPRSKKKTAQTVKA